MTGVQTLDGVLIGCHKSVATKIRWDEDNFTGWHGYDADFSYRCYRNGFNVTVSALLPLVHYTKSTFYSDDFIKFQAIFAQKHYNLKNINYVAKSSRGMNYLIPKSLDLSAKLIEDNYLTLMVDCANYRFNNIDCC